MNERDQIWKYSFNTFYDSFFYELLSDRMINKWLLVDTATRVIVAITTSGSAIAGWALWNQEGWRYLWAGLAGMSAVLSIIHATMNVTQRIKEWTENKRSFSSLRIECETQRAEMGIDYTFDIDKHKKLFNDSMKKYGTLYLKIPNDILVSKKLKNRIQEELNNSIKNYLE